MTNQKVEPPQMFEAEGPRAAMIDVYAVDDADPYIQSLKEEIAKLRQIIADVMYREMNGLKPVLRTGDAAWAAIEPKSGSPAEPACHCEHGPNGPPLLRRDLKPWEHEFSCSHYQRAVEPSLKPPKFNTLVGNPDGSVTAGVSDTCPTCGGGYTYMGEGSWSHGCLAARSGGLCEYCGVWTDDIGSPRACASCRRDLKGAENREAKPT